MLIPCLSAQGLNLLKLTLIIYQITFSQTALSKITRFVIFLEWTAFIVTKVSHLLNFVENLLIKQEMIICLI